MANSSIYPCFGIFQWNCRSLKPKKDIFRIILKERNITFFALSETWLAKESEFSIPGYNLIREDRDEPYGGVMLGIRSRVEFSRIALPRVGLIESVACVIKYKSMRFSILALYIPSNFTLHQDHLQQLISCLEAPYFILGDFNSKGTAWGNPSNDTRSRVILDVLDDNGLHLLNTDKVTRIACPPASNSSIDLSIVSARLALYCDWQVIEDPMSSDHLPMTIVFNPKGETEEFTIPYDWSKNVDWLKFRAIVGTYTTNLNNITCPDDQYSELIDKIDEALRVSQTKPVVSSFTRKQSPNFWWDKECVMSRDEKINAYKQFRRSGRISDFLEFKKREAMFTRICKLKKRDYWENLVATLDKDSNMSSLWKIARKLRNRHVATPLQSYSESWMDTFVDKTCPPFVPVNINFQSNQQTPCVSQLSIPFTFNELNLALSQCENTAPGLDGIKFIVLKNLPENTKLLLLQIFNKFLEINHVPEIWKKVKTVTVLKPGKDATLPDSYRPISLLSCPRKITEKMILNRLQLWAESSNFLSETQYGFRRGKGTQDCLALLATDIQLAFNRKEEMVAVFLDVRSAYDTVLLDLLHEKLIKLSLPEKIANFIYNLMASREMHFFLNNSSRAVRFSSIGLPQGSCLSPFLYNLYINEIDKCISNGCVLVQLADDAAIWCTDRDPKNSQTKLQNSITSLQSWADNLGLSFSTLKTEFVVFSNKHNPSDITLKLYDQPIKRSMTFKYLGIWFDAKCKWRTHIDYVVKKCQQRINFLRMLTGTWWGAHPRCLLMFYKSAIRSVIEYGSQVFSCAAKTHLSKLVRLQNRCLRISIGSLNSTHIGSLEVMCGIPPLNIRMEELQCRFLVGCIQMNHMIIPKLDQLFDISPGSRFLHCFRLCVSREIHKPPGRIYQDFNINAISFIPNVDLSLFESLRGVPRSHISQSVNSAVSEKIKFFNPLRTFYTDGSINENGAGFGIFEENYQIGHKLLSPCSVFTAEASAILHVCRILQDYPKGNYVICSDSLSTLSSLNSYHMEYHYPYTLYAIREIAFQLQENGTYLIFLWVPAHCGINGNELADAIAKTGSVDGPIYSRGVQAREYIPDIRTQVMNSWQLAWNQGNLGRFCYSILPKVTLKPWFHNMDVNRQFIKNMSRILANHYTLASHLFRINMVSTNICSCQTGYEDIDHVIWICKKYDNKRHKLFRELNKSNKNLFTPIRDILAIKDLAFMNIVNSFITDAKIIL